MAKEKKFDKAKNGSATKSSAGAKPATQQPPAMPKTQPPPPVVNLPSPQPAPAATIVTASGQGGGLAETRLTTKADGLVGNGVGAVQSLPPQVTIDGVRKTSGVSEEMVCTS